MILKRLKSQLLVILYIYSKEIDLEFICALTGKIKISVLYCIFEVRGLQVKMKQILLPVSKLKL